MKKLVFFSALIKDESPAQQILDRCLTGWPKDGRFIESPFEKVSAYGSRLKQNLKHREGVPNLAFEDSIEKAMADADAWILAAGENNNWACCTQYLHAAIRHAPKPMPGWIVGLPAGFATDQVSELLLTHGDHIQVGTPLPWTWRLPEADLAAGTELKEVVVLIRGTFPTAEQEGIDALLALTSHRQGGESGLSSITRLTGNEVWKAAKEGRFSWDVFSAAVSRTNSKLGDATIDGRTQDIVGLGMIPQLAKGTRAWILEHKDGLKSTIITMDGILNDDNFAIRTKAGDTISAQFYRPPKPNDHQYTRLMDRIASFLIGEKNALPPQRTLLWAKIIQHMKDMEKGNLSNLKVNDKGLAYTLPTSTWKP